MYFPDTFSHFSFGRTSWPCPVLRLVWNMFDVNRSLLCIYQALYSQASPDIERGCGYIILQSGNLENTYFRKRILFVCGVYKFSLHYCFPCNVFHHTALFYSSKKATSKSKFTGERIIYFISFTEVLSPLSVLNLAIYTPLLNCGK